jgi:Type I phosphodiesterase / nucleotide pyrophosphatase
VRKTKIASLLFLAAATASVTQAQSSGVSHVLLVSIDGMHVLDYLNCTQGIAGVNGGLPYCPNIAALNAHAVNYLYTSTSKPSDSFPGLMALMTGGSPRSVGAFYDDAFDRSLDGPAVTTGDGNPAAPCTAGTPPTGYTTEYDEGIDYNQNVLNGGAPAGVDGGVQSIDPAKLDRDPANGCAPVWPWNFVRTNSIFGVIHAAGGYTAWSDKHPSYSAVNGHQTGGTAGNLNDYYSPEINSGVVALPGVTTPLGVACSPIRDTLTTATGSWTDSFENIQCYDSLKVNAVLNWIKGLTHDGKTKTQVPNIFGMNFQVVSVGQKLIERDPSGTIITNGTGGYLDAYGTPTPGLLSEIQFVDAAVGEWVAEIQSQGLEQSTMIILTAKHGQSPIDSSHYKANGSPNTPADVISALLYPSEINPSGVGPTQDDVSLLWLQNSANTAAAVSMLEPQSAPLGIGEIFVGRGIAQLFNTPGPTYNPPQSDPRSPDILITPNIGVTYSNSKTKLAEHGGFSHDDTNVMMMLYNPSFTPATIYTPVETAQIAPTILQVLGLDPASLDAVQQEGTAVLPGAAFATPLGWTPGIRRFQ